mgnify:CR=1 FL=1
MSTLNVSNITDGTTTVGTNYVVNGSAKAWVNFNGTGTIAIRDSQGVSGLVDNGTGDYTINFSSSFSSVNYASSGFCGEDANMAGFRNNIGFNTVSSQRVAATLYSGSRNDQSLYTCITHGDLA